MATTSQTRRVLAAFLADPTGEHAGLDLSARAGLPHGAIYPALAWLEEAGWITSRWRSYGPARYGGDRRRRYYQLTAAGVTAARTLARPRPRGCWTSLLTAPAWPVVT